MTISKKPAHKKPSHEEDEKDLDQTMEQESRMNDDRDFRMPSSRPPYLLIVLLMAISFFAGYLVFKVANLQQKLDAAGTGGTAQNAQAQVPAAPRDIKVKKPNADDHWRGSKNARFVWIEYSDYECPFCKRNHPDVVKLMSEVKDLAWVYRQYPLPFHPKAQKSAEGSECAADMGGNDAFWKYTDEVFDKMPDIELSQLPDVASDIGLDSNAFKQCLDSGKFEKKVKDSSAEGTQAGVQATPTGIIYDTKTGKMQTVEGALPYDDLKQQAETFMAQK